MKTKVSILPQQMKTPRDAAEVFAEYMNYWMKERGMDSRAVVAKAKRKFGTPSDATMTNILSGKPADMLVRTVEALAYAIRRPPEEVFMARLGHWREPATKDFELQISEFAVIERRLAEMPNGEHKRAIVRFLRMLERELDEPAHPGDRR